MDRLGSLAVFLVIVVLTAALSGQFVGDQWYQGMHQPSWNPSATIMTLVWPVMYVLMGMSAWLVWDTHRDSASIALGWWIVLLVLGVGWSWMYFGLHRVGWALALMSLWVICSLIVVYAFRSIRKEASGLMMPVAGWLLFSWVLNFVQWSLNGGGIG